MRIPSLLITGGLSLLAICQAHSANRIWADTGSQFNLASNWSGGTAPNSTDIAVFNSFTNQPTLDIGYAVGGIVLNTVGVQMTGSGSITLREDGITSVGSGKNYIGVALSINGGANSATFDVGTSNTLELGGVLTFTGKSWIKTGEGTLITDGANVGTSGKGSNIKLLGGTLYALNSSFSGGAEEILISGARLLTEQTGGFTTNASLNIRVGNGGAIFENAISGAGNLLIIKGAISDAPEENGNVTFKGASTSTLIQLGNKQNSYSGTTTVDGAMLRINKSTITANILPKMSTVTLVNNAILDMNGAAATETLGALAGNGTVQATSISATFEVGENNTSTTFSGVIKDNTGKVTINKVGTGQWTLSGANTYTGATNINSGVLYLESTGSLGNTAIALSNATLAGRGSALGVVTTAGISSIISSTGNLKLGGVDATNGATFTFDLTTISQLQITGALIGSSAPGKMQFDFSGGNENVIYTLIKFGSTSSVDVAKFIVLPSGYKLDESFHDGGWYLDSTTGALQVRFSAIPEPSAYMFLISGFAFFGMMTRLRRLT